MRFILSKQLEFINTQQLDFYKMNIQRNNIPTSPGVYFFKNSLGEIIYIGKAKNLRNRVMSYFTSEHQQSPKTRILVKNIDSFEYLLVDNEVESLLLENKLIKKHTPKYNINLKDAKTYAYIKITQEELPKILITRKVTSTGEYFGPFIDSRVRNELYSLVVDLFTLITPKTYASKSRLYYEIGKAPGLSLQDIHKEKYLEQVKQAKQFLRGTNISDVKKHLKTTMLDASSKQQYEIAKECKAKLDAIEYLKEKQKVDLLKNYDQDVIVELFDKDFEKSIITLFHIGKGVISSKQEYSFDYDEHILSEFIKMIYSKQIPPSEIIVGKKIWSNEEEKEHLETYFSKLRGSKVSLVFPQRGEKKHLVNLALKNSRMNSKNYTILKEMKEKLHLPKIPSIIECFDMSNLGSQDVVGGMTRWIDGKADKEGYRKFEIKSFSGRQDDFAAMREVVFRRYHRLKYEGKSMPDLIIIDGGKGQLGMAQKALKDAGVTIPMISLAKKEEEIFLPNEENSLIFKKDSPMMLHIREIRDSVHNYVVAYNRKKRQMRMKEDFKKIEKDTSIN